MRNYRTMSILTLAIAIGAVCAGAVGIWAPGGEGEFIHESIRGEQIRISGTGLYQHMSWDVAVQGIAQDYVTVFFAVPALLLGLVWTRRGGMVPRLVLTGTLGYFFITYLFYLCMGMYNYLFLLYVALAGMSFLALLMNLLEFDLHRLQEVIHRGIPVRFPGVFLVINGINIALLWLMAILPPLLDGTVYPEGLDHYTTMIVQGLDLALLLPLSIICGVMLQKKRPLGLLGGAVYLVFLVFLMSALTAKLVGMSLVGAPVMPAIILIPLTLLVDVSAAVWLLRGVGRQA